MSLELSNVYICSTILKLHIGNRYMYRVLSVLIDMADKLWQGNVEQIIRLANPSTPPEVPNLEEFYMQLRKLEASQGDVALWETRGNVVTLNQLTYEVTESLLNEAQKEVGEENLKKLNQLGSWQEYRNYYTGDLNLRKTVGELNVDTRSNVRIK